VAVLFLPDDDLVVALATAVTAGGGAALPAGETIGGDGGHGQSDEGKQDAHGARI